MAFRLNDILNFLGLPEIPEAEKRNGEGKGGAVRPAGKVKKGYSPEEDEFDDGPQVKRVPRNGSQNGATAYSPRTQGQSNAYFADDDFEDADAIWGSDNTSSTARPNYTYGKRSAHQQPEKQNAPKGYTDRVENPYTANAGKNSGARRSGYQDTKYYGGENMNYSVNRESQESSRMHQLKICRIRSVDECKDVIRTLLAKTTVSLNLEELDTLQQQRVVDMMVGATFAIGAKMTRSGTGCWMLTPSTVEVDDKQAVNSNAFL